MDIRRAAVYCRGEEKEFQAGLAAAYINDKGLSFYDLFVDDPDGEEPIKSLLKLIDHCRYGSIDVVIMRNYDIIEDPAVKKQLSKADLPQPIIGAEDFYCTDESLNLETLKYEKKHKAVKNTTARAKTDETDSEISEALRQLLERRKRSGHIAGVVPYGFRRMDGKLIPDPVTAPVVRDIFSKALEGERITTICEWLSAQGIANPSNRGSSERAVRAYDGDNESLDEPEVTLVDRATGDVVKNLTPTTSTVETAHTSRWSDNTVRDMLRNDIYTQGVISRDVFDRVQERFDENKPEVTMRTRGLYQGLVHCGSCQRSMSYQGTDVNGRKKATYFCKFHTGTHPKSEPFDHMPKVDEEVLKEEVLRQCNDYIEGFSEKKLVEVLGNLEKKELEAKEKLIDLGRKLICKTNVSGKKYKGLWTSWEHARRRRMMAIAYSVLLSHRFKVYQFGHMDQNDLDTERKLMKSITVHPDGRVVVNFSGDDVLRDV